VIEADSLDTGNKQRDKHLPSDDFFDVANHPQVRFEANAATLDVAGTITPVDDGFEIEATALADHRELGMTWSPLGTLRAPSKLIVRGRLIRTENVR
jgi:YceI-like domain